MHRELLLSRMPTGKETGEEAGAGPPIYDRLAGVEWLFPSQRGGIEGCMLQKKR